MNNVNIMRMAVVNTKEPYLWTVMVFVKNSDMRIKKARTKNEL